MRGVFSSIVSVFVVVFMFACRSTTEERVDKVSGIFNNGKHYVVNKINKDSQLKGIFTKHNYGNTHSFTYDVAITQGKIKWEGGSGEPKGIVFCKDTTYIRYLKNKLIFEKHRDSITDSIVSRSKYVLKEVFEKHMDERYLFKLFGDDYWTEITSKEYMHKKEQCIEYAIPNDQELTFKTEALLE